MTHSESARPLRGLALATVTAVLWGTVPIAGTVALGGMSAPLLSVLRLVAAAALLALLLGRARARALRKPPRLVLLAALGLGANYVFYRWGLEHAGAGTSQVLIQHLRYNQCHLAIRGDDTAHIEWKIHNCDNYKILPATTDGMKQVPCE